MYLYIYHINNKMNYTLLYIHYTTILYSYINKIIINFTQLYYHITYKYIYHNIGSTSFTSKYVMLIVDVHCTVHTPTFYLCIKNATMSLFDIKMVCFYKWIYIVLLGIYVDCVGIFNIYISVHSNKRAISSSMFYTYNIF